MDCPICFNVIKKSAMGPCTHHFCLPCLLKWCEFGAPSGAPTIKEGPSMSTVCILLLLREFNKLV